MSAARPTSPTSRRGRPSRKTGSLKFTTDFRSNELKDLEIPLEVRALDSTVMARTTSLQTVGELPPGQYYVVASLPGGQNLSQAVKIPKNPSSLPVEVQLSVRESQRSARETDERTEYMGLPVRTALSSAPPVDQAGWRSPVPLSQDPASAFAATTGTGASTFESAPRDARSGARQGGLEMLGAAPSGFTMAALGESESVLLLAEFAALQSGMPPPTRAAGRLAALEVMGPAGPATAPAIASQAEVQAAAGPLDVQLAFFRGNPLSFKSSLVVDNTPWIASVADRSIRIAINGNDSPCTLQVIEAGRPPLNIALPVSTEHGCLVEISRLAAPLNPTSDVDVISIDVHLDSAAANSLLRYRAMGELRQVETSLGDGQTLTAHHLLSEKFEDPVAAVVGGYTLLRFNKLDRLPDSWTKNLSNRFEWLPDGAVVRGEHLARLGRHDEALDAFLLLSGRGLPMFTEGLGYVMDRLDLYLRTLESSLSRDALQRARGLTALLRKFCEYSSNNRQLLSYTGVSPNRPGSEVVRDFRGGEPGLGLLTLRLDPNGAAIMPNPRQARGNTPTMPLETQGAAEPSLRPTARSLALPEAVLAATEQRFAERTAERTAHIEKIDKAKERKGSLLEVDDQDRIALRSQRVLSQPGVRDILASGPGGNQLETLGTVDPIVLERIIGGDNLLGTAFLKIGTKVSRTVARVVVRGPAGATLGFGTASLVSPRLVMTNNHVFPDILAAQFSEVEFDYETGEDGRPLPLSVFRLEPSMFFYTDPDLDFTIVAVTERSQDGRSSIGDFGFNRLTEELGKVVLGESVNIVQHPDGRPKQIALQQNELIDRLENFLHYRTDTLPGSSGSPVFNNQWEMIALHHSGVAARDANGRILSRDDRIWTPDMGEAAVKWIANEGARISSIIARLRSLTSLSPQQQALLDQLLTPPILAPETQPSPAAILNSPGDSQPMTSSTSSALDEPNASRAASPAQSTIAGEIVFNVPLTISVRLGTPDAVQARPVAPATSARTDLLERLTPKQPIVDRNYASRAGYDPAFLGPNFFVPLPTVADPTTVSTMADGRQAIPYEHFSIVMHKSRRLALFTASNVDGRQASRRPEPGRDYSRKGLTGLGPNNIEEWVTEARIPSSHQLPDKFYSNDRGAFDKGHVVRRDDVCFGTSFAQIQRANGDTYHTTNCSPQVSGYNQSARGVDNWGDLENFVLLQAKVETYCVFAGPIFQQTDREFHGVGEDGPLRVKIPRSYWKVVVAAEAGSLQTFAFVLDQDLSDLRLETPAVEEAMEPSAFEFEPTREWRRRMVAISTLEERLGNTIRFSEVLRQADQFGKPNGDEIVRIARMQS
ncbi:MULTISPECIES: DNA/RNA non-specific endonuclease [unclassified Mesorhizobium]|uniref:DNA/RNA non-specific endonuclease n=1 Tax=unclassified Mesorhizobium TaxID=325217 RepID=UPI0009FEC330|nr:MULTISPECIES: DNA/RNA non-specific endonuclease [unclassified Mesorhizobium]